MNTVRQLAPELDVARWLNSAQSITLASLRGRAVVVGAFQMLCPGCVSHLIPQLKEVQEAFPEKDVAVLGLHSVFEHHAAMTEVSLAAFLHEYRIGFPVGIDRAVPGSPLPATMRRYQMRGTPTLLLIDREGRLVRQAFGHVRDLRLGAEIAMLMQDVPEERADFSSTPQSGSCADGVCQVG